MVIQSILAEKSVPFELQKAAQNRINFRMAEPEEELIPTRATLIQRLKNWQDQASWQDFFDAYWRLIHGVAIKQGLSKVEAQDVVQETMVAVAKQMPAFKYDPATGSFKSWLMNLTRWRIADQFRKRESSVEYQESTSETSLGDAKMDGEKTAGKGAHVLPDLDRIWDDEWEKNLLEVALAKARRHLDPKQYQLFDFYVNKEWEADRVAKLFGVSLNQVYLAKSRVTETIRLEIERLQKEML
jgi:RNA polymerase sigma-70 factor (ECF subfamily)